MSSRIEMLQNLVNLLADKWLLLDSRAELLRPALTDKRLVESFNNSGKAQGFDLVRMSLAELCLIQASGLLSSTEDTDVSLSSLIEDLRTSNGQVYKALKNDFCAVEEVNIIDNGKLSPAVLEHLRAEHVREESLRKSAQFDDEAKQIIFRYDKLMEKEDGLGHKIKTIRNKVLAHFGTRYEEGRRVLQSTADYGLIVNDIFDIVEELRELCEKCVLVICNSGLDFDNSRQWHDDQSRAFWSLQER